MYLGMLFKKYGTNLCVIERIVSEDWDKLINIMTDFGTKYIKENVNREPAWRDSDVHNPDEQIYSKVSYANVITGDVFTIEIVPVKVI